MAEIEIGARIDGGQLAQADKIVHDVAVAHNAKVVASGAGFGMRDWTIDVGRSRRRQRVGDAICAALRDAGVDVPID